MVSERYDGSIPVNDLKFSTTAFWVQIHDLPYSYINTETTICLGKSLGEVYTSKDTSEMRGGSFMCVRDILNILDQCNRPKPSPICISSLGFSRLYILMLWFIITQVIVLHSYTIKM